MAEPFSPSTSIADRSPTANGDSAPAVVDAAPFYAPPRVGVLSWIFLAVLTIVLAALIRTTVFESFRIPSESMIPTLMPGDYIFVAKYELGFDLTGQGVRQGVWRKPERGDVVVFSLLGEASANTDQTRFIKRIVALPGETIEIENFVAYVNGKIVDTPESIRRSNNPQTIADHRGRWGPVLLGSDEYFVLGDNRINSEDSRYLGPIRSSDIEGRATFIYWSAGDEGLLTPRWKRVFKGIQ